MESLFIATVWFSGNINSWVVSIDCSSEFVSANKNEAIAFANDFAKKWQKFGCAVVIK